MKACKMISLDTSSTVTGYAIFVNGKLKESGTIDMKKEKDSVIRMEDMCLAIINLLNKQRPDIVVAELNVIERNAKTQRMLSEIIGVLRGWSLCNYAEFVTLEPTVWRKLVKFGDESLPRKREELKKWSVARVEVLFDMQVSDDESDAILVGQARINMMDSLS